MLEANKDQIRRIHCFDDWSFEVGFVDCVDGLAEAEVGDDIHGHAPVGPKEI